MSPQTRATDGAMEETSELVVPEGWASVLFDKAFQLAETYSANIKARKANRESLRNLKDQGLLSEGELEELEELYPERESRRRTDEERAVELEAQAKKVRERAKKRAKGTEAKTTPAAV